MAQPASDAHDPTVYRVEYDVGEHELQTYILELLRPLIERFLRQRGMKAHVGSDQFMYWRQHDPAACVAPDIYLLPGVPQEIAIDVWKVWERGIVPSFALKVVGPDPRKDYEEAPKRYAELGVDELIVFDPFPGPDRVAFRVYRRDETGLPPVVVTAEDAVVSQVLGCHIRRVGDGAATRLRLATGEDGRTLIPTAEEAEQAERAAKEAERAAKEAERAAKEGERAAKEAALARVAELEAELKRRG